MKTRTFTITHASLVNFKDISNPLWRDFSAHPYNLDWFKFYSGTLWHQTYNAEVGVTSDFKLGEQSVVELNGKRYIAWTNFGFDQKVLAFSIVGIEGEKLSPDIFTNSVKLYTTEPATKKFLAGTKLFR